MRHSGQVGVCVGALAFLAVTAWPHEAGAGQGPAGKPQVIDRSAKDREVRAKLAEKVALDFKGAPLEDVLKFVKKASQGPNDAGIPIYVDPIGLQEAEATLTTKVSVTSKPGEPLGDALKRLLEPVKLTYLVKDGLFTVTSKQAVDEGKKPPGKAEPKRP